MTTATTASNSNPTHLITVSVTKSSTPVSGVNVELATSDPNNTTFIGQAKTTAQGATFRVEAGCYYALLTAPTNEYFDGVDRNWDTVEGCVGTASGNASETLALSAALEPEVAIPANAIRLQASHQPVVVTGSVSGESPVQRYAVEGVSGAQYSILLTAVNGDTECGSHTVDPILTMTVDGETTHKVATCGAVIRRTFSRNLVILFEVRLPSEATAGLSYQLRLEYEAA